MNSVDPNITATIDPPSAGDSRHRQTPERLAIVRWAAGLGAVTAEAGAVRLGVTVASARGRLLGAVREGLLARHRPLTAHPTLYVATRTGLRAAGVRDIEPCLVSATNAVHLIECAHVAAALERCYPDHRVQGERELRREEREQGRALASPELAVGARADRSGSGRSELGRQRHRPDLVLWPRDPGAGPPVAVEVELTVKAPERLAEICRAWARTRQVAGVLYLAPPDVERALLRAIERVRAHDRVIVVPLEALPNGPADASGERTVPSGS
jgi:hypothetical protein